MHENNATIKRRELLINVARRCFERTLQETVDRIPVERYPKNGGTARCCVHASRAILRDRIKAVLGFSIEDEQDELTPLADYAKRACARENLGGPILTVVDEACNGCVRANYFVTNACRGCLARPCMMNCPKKAITMKNGQALIDPELCVNCGICKNVCPYHAIIYVPIPCEEACPVGAITKNAAGKEEIDYDKCIYCGKCVKECPFGAIMEKSHIVDVIRHMQEGKKVVAMVAPAIIGQFPGTFGQLVDAIKRVGFYDVVEVARGADMTAAHEAAEFIERMKEGAPFMTSSCCPAYTEAVKKHVPEIADKVSETKTPMHYTADMVTAQCPNAVRVFVGPCIAKRKEAFDDEHVDYVLTFEELGALFIAKDIDVAVCDDVEIKEPAHKAGRGFPVSGGVTEALQTTVGCNACLKPHMVDGLSKKSLMALKAFAKGKAPGNFIEVMSCEGGCIAGPGVISPVKLAERKVKDFVSKESV